MIDTSKTYTSNSCGDFKIIEYKSHKDILVEFLLTGFKIVTQSSHIRRGKVKDKLYPKVFGVGFFGDGPYGSKVNSESANRRCYDSWHNMMERCYGSRCPSYKNVTVCKEWHNFQNFAEWFDKHHIEGFHLDKDINQKGFENKVYSPDVCIFVSRDDNIEEALAKNYRMRAPCGLIHEIYNMAKFSRVKNLDPHCMTRVHSGGSGSHKGWTKA